MPVPYQREKPSPLTRDELILERLKDIKEGQRELKADLQAAKHELNDRIDKLDERMDRLETRMDKLETRIDGSIHHTQIMTATVVGVALAVIYFVFTH